VSPRPARTGWTYAKAGVDRSDVGKALHALLSGVRYRPPATSGRQLDLPGHYAGLVRIGRETIAVTTDTVGTKVLLAEELGRWEGIGEDVVAVNVNDLAAVGARPFGLVDCISCDRPRPEAFAAIGRGIDRGLRASQCALLGGETAVVPDIVQGVDVGGTALGFLPGRRRPVTGDRIRPGDVVLGLDSSGLHANGFTLVRRLLAKQRPDLGRRVPGERRPLGRALLAPTRIYVAASEAVADDPGVHGLAHISGGGVRNLVRLHPTVRFVLDHWPKPSGLFEWARQAGDIALEELYQTFNGGIGFVVVTSRASVPRVTDRLRRAGFGDARPVGRVERGEGVSVPSAGLEFSGYA
jgi:phosphoribosylformylglycinamidine cyclo-ligase